MRGGFIIVAILFWLSVRFEFPEQMVRGSECEVAQSGRYLQRDYTTVFAGLVNKGGDVPQMFSILQKYPLYYFATEYDTTRLSDFTDASFDPLNRIDFDKTFPSLTVFDKESIRNMLSPHWDSTDRFLMQVNDGDVKYLGAGRIIEAQLDFDPETERIIQFNNGWFHTYVFYENYGSYWQYLSTVHVYDTSGDNEPDFSLDGFVGLKEWSHGTFHSANDYTYYRIEHGHLTEKFRINTYAYQGLLWMSENLYLGTKSETELLQVGSSQVFAEHRIEIYSYDPGVDSSENILRSEIVTYSLVEQDDGTFLPDKTLVGFNTSYATTSSMNTYFLPEAYANSEINKLKENGNPAQRELLKDFVYDSTATFR